jgi:hypothetical protein
MQPFAIEIATTERHFWSRRNHENVFHCIHIFSNVKHLLRYYIKNRDKIAEVCSQSPNVRSNANALGLRVK